MRAYAAYGRVLASAYVLPELAGAADGSVSRAALTIAAVTRGPFAGPESASNPSHPREARGGDDPLADPLDDPWLTVERTAGGFLLHFGATATFSLSQDATRVGLHHAGPLSDDLRHLLIDQVVPLALAHQGALVLHASALVVDGKAVALVGPSGAGKSTLAASLVHDGCALLADDALVVEMGEPAGPRELGELGETGKLGELGGPWGNGAVAQPSYPGLRLWPDVLADVAGGGEPPPVASYTEKRRVVPGRSGFVCEPRALFRLYVIDEEDHEQPAHEQPAVVPLSHREAAMALLQHSYVLDPGDTARLRAQFRAACDLLDRVAVRRLKFPRVLDRLPEVRACLRSDLATGPGPARGEARRVPPVA
ncbi:MAG: hypothetical protein AB7O32_10640 [Vicinamibacterales bacterium]